MAFPDQPTIISPATTCIACNAPHNLQAANHVLSAKLANARDALETTLVVARGRALRRLILSALELTQP